MPIQCHRDSTLSDALPYLLMLHINLETADLWKTWGGDAGKFWVYSIATASPPGLYVFKKSKKLN